MDATVTNCPKPCRPKMGSVAATPCSSPRTLTSIIRLCSVDRNNVPAAPAGTSTGTDRAGITPSLTQAEGSAGVESRRSLH